MLRIIKYISKCKLELIFSYDANLIKEIKEKFVNYKYIPKKKVWHVYLTASNYEKELSFFKSKNFEFINKEDREKIKKCLNEYKQKEKYLNKIKPNDEAIINEKSIDLIRDYQLVVYEYLLKYKRILLGDEMGLGKTLQIIYAIKELNLYPTIIVCPNILKYNWKNEFLKWIDIPEDDISIISSNNYKIKSKKKIDKNDFNKKIVIINYDLLKKYEEKIKTIKWKMLIVDEAHNLKSNKAIRTKIIKKIAKKVEYISLMTGTPVMNKPTEIIPLLQILGVYDIVGGYKWFMDNYIGGYNWTEKRTWWSERELKSLHEALARTVYIRREKKEILKDLPEKIRSVIIFDMINHERELMEAEKNQIIRLLSNIEKLPEGIIEDIKSKDLNSIYNDLHILISENILDRSILQIIKLTLIKAYQLATINVKLPYIYEWLDNFVENNPKDKIVIFGIHKEPLKKLKEYLDKKYKTDTPIINGDISEKKRQQYLKDFKEKQNVKFILLNIRAGGTGLTLTNSNYLLFIEFDWTPAYMLQAEDRIHRIGQEKTSYIYYLALNNSIDLVILNRLNTKMKYASAVNSGEIIELSMNKIDGNKLNLYNKLFK